MATPLKAVEFFSGIGAFAEACRFTGIEVVEAFDQNEHANKVYESNFDLSPNVRNIETLSAKDVPDASIWWMSPPCTPFSRRGKQRDDEDPRARALLRLLEILPERTPEYVFVENVEGFIGSKTEQRLNSVLNNHGYKQTSFSLCSSMFGVPMRRPRFFIVASRTCQPLPPELTAFSEARSLSEFLTENEAEDLRLPDEELEKHRAVLNVVDPNVDNAYLICFTRGYFKCRKASGSFIQLPDGGVRFVAPSEILDLFGFSPEYRFPELLPKQLLWRLVGNSVDVRAIKAVLTTVGLVCE